MSGGQKTTIAEYGQTHGIYPGTATAPTAASLAVTGKFASSAVTEDTGVITVTMAAAGVASAAVAGGTIILTPPALNTNPTSFNFACTSSTIKAKFLPKTCTSTAT